MKSLLLPTLLSFSIVSGDLMAQQTTAVSGLPFSATYTANDLTFISGQVGIDETTGKLVTASFEAEANQVMKNLLELLKKEGLTFSDIVTVTIYLKSIDHYQLTNDVYRSYFNGKFPARVCIAVADLPVKANIEISAVASNKNGSAAINKEVVRQFLETVRTGKHPEKAALFMADTVKAHQMNAEEQTTVDRTPENYTDHVKEFLRLYGNYSFETTELMAEGDKVYARWLQKGKQLAEIDGYAPTGKPLTEMASCVYRLKNEKIVEYWIQIDRAGFDKQLQRNK